MNIATMNRLDLNLKLLKGSVLEVGNIKIKPKTVGEVIDFGYTLYMGLLSVMTSKVEDFLGKDFKNKEGITILDVILTSGNEELITSLLNSLIYFLDLDGQKFTYIEEVGIVFGDMETLSMDELVVIDNSNIHQISNIIMYQNCVKYPSDSDAWNPRDEKAKAIIAKMEASRKKVAQAKKKQSEESGDEIDIHSVISAVTAKSNSISKFNVWDLNIYQLYDEFKRIEMIDGYETSIMAMMQGASIKDIKHWSTKMEV